ncbi:MAG: hypothetical protein EON52_10590 [Actinomycetales bacterium]|nr:MAG: hypothetical protein EON52_10590 [Actinomycetales bacterium]
MKLRHALAAGLTCLVALTACGGSDDAESDDPEQKSSSSSKESAASLLADAKKEIGASKAFSMKGSIDDDGDRGQIDITYAGDDVQGSFSIGSQGSFELALVDDASYVKGSKQFWTDNADAEAADRFAGKWVTSTSFGDLADEFSRDSFVDEIFEPEGKVTIGPDKTINGVDCITLVDNEKGKKSYLYLDAEDHRPLQISQDGGDVVISYEGVTLPEKPAAVLDVDALAG